MPPDEGGADTWAFSARVPVPQHREPKEYSWSANQSYSASRITASPMWCPRPSTKPAPTTICRCVAAVIVPFANSVVLT